MTMPPPDLTGLPAWHVLGDQITTTTVPAPGLNGLIDLHVIPYMIDSGPAAGTIRQVKVQPDNFTPDYVKNAIVTDLSNVHLIASLDTRNGQLA